MVSIDIDARTPMRKDTLARLEYSGITGVASIALTGGSNNSERLPNGQNGNVAVTLNNFCKLQDMSADDEDDILSCVHFLLVDVMTARRVLKGLAA